MGPAPQQSGPRPEEPLRAAEPAGFQRFPLFDAGRAIAVLAVVSVHAAGNAETTKLPALIAHLGVGVVIFFLISGFLLYRPFVASHAAGGPPPATGPYAWRRLLRIVPAYWVALTVAAVALGVSGVLDSSDGLAYYGFAQIYQEHTQSGGLPLAWSLDIEIAFYLVLPLYALAVRRAARSSGSWVRAELAGLVALVGVAGAYRAVFLLSTSADEFYPLALRWLPSYLDYFALGMGLALLSVWVQRRGAAPRSVERLTQRPALPLAAAAATMLVLSRLPAAFQERPSHFEALAVPYLYALVALLVLVPIALDGAGPSSPVRRVLSLRPLLYVGTISYGIYLWHRPLLAELAERGVDFGSGPLAYGAWALLGLAAAAAAATISWFGLERPVLRLKRLFPDRSTGPSR